MRSSVSSFVFVKVTCDSSREALLSAAAFASSTVMKFEVSTCGFLSSGSRSNSIIAPVLAFISNSYS
jgi:hypothetical protein